MIKLRFTKENYNLYKKLEKEGYLKVTHLENNLIIKTIPNLKLQKVSKPSRKIYLNWEKISKGYKQGLGVLIIQTNNGYKTDMECIKEKIGGKVIMKVF